MTSELKLHLYREMVRIRRFEKSCFKEYCWGEMGGWLNLTIGQEGLPVVLRSIMGKNDHTVTGPRGIAAALAGGIPMASVVAELYGYETGCSQGKGGMFSLFNPAGNHWGCHATAAAQTPLALGFGFALKYRGQEGVSFCTLGDGAVNQGVFHETLNLAGLFDLPVVFLIENNQFGMGTSVRRASAFKDHLARRAETYNIDWDLADGWRLDDLHQKLLTARTRALSESRPTVLEIATYRHYGFTIADANHKKYRSPEEIEFHKKHRDPIKTWGDRLTTEGLLDAALISEIENTAKKEAKEAIKNARIGSPPPLADLTKHVYWETDHDTAAGRQGRHIF